MRKLIVRCKPCCVRKAKLDYGGAWQRARKSESQILGKLVNLAWTLGCVRAGNLDKLGRLSNIARQRTMNLMTRVIDNEQKRAIDLSPDKSGLADWASQSEQRCLVCHSLVPGARCGRKAPCPGCGYLYPLGDCSDGAE